MRLWLRIHSVCNAVSCGFSLARLSPAMKKCARAVSDSSAGAFILLAVSSTFSSLSGNRRLPSDDSRMSPFFPARKSRTISSFPYTPNRSTADDSTLIDRFQPGPFMSPFLFARMLRVNWMTLVVHFGSLAGTVISTSARSLLLSTLDKTKLWSRNCPKKVVNSVSTYSESNTSSSNWCRTILEISRALFSPEPLMCVESWFGQ